jgi:hypothetical protein
VISSKNVYINEQSDWDWKKQEELEIEEIEEQPKVMIPTPNTVISGSARDKEVVEITRNGAASSSRSLGREERNEDEEDEPRQPRFRSLNDIYNTTCEVHLMCLLADAENITFEEASRDEKWRKAMNSMPLKKMRLEN